MKSVNSLTDIKKEFGSVTAALLKKQCDIIGIDSRKINFKESGWWCKYTWTGKQEAKFKKWFVKYLYGHLKRTREIANFAHIVYKKKKKLEILWSWWNLDYGWKRGNDEKEKI